MQLNNKVKIVKDSDILMTDNDNIGKSLADVIEKQTDEINKLKSNVKYIYTHGGIGGGMGGSGGGNSSTTWDALVTLGGTTLEDGNPVIFTKPGTYKLFVKILRAGGGTYSVKCKSECDSNEDAMGSQAYGFDNLYQFEINLNLSNNNMFVSVVIEDDMGSMKVIKCQYIVKPIESDFKLFKGGNTVNENLDGGMLLLNGEGITQHQDSPYVEFFYRIGVPITNLEMTFNFGNYLTTEGVVGAYTEADKDFFDVSLFDMTPNARNGSLNLVMKKDKLKQNGYVRLYLNDIKSALGDGAGYSILNPRNSNQYNISVEFNAVSSIGTMTSNLKTSFVAVPESVFMIVADTSQNTHYFSETDVSTQNANGDLLASNESIWLKKDDVTTKYVYSALTVGDGLTSNVKVFENELSEPRNNYRVTWVLTPCCVNFDSENDKMMLSKETFKTKYLAAKDSSSSALDSDIELLYNHYTKKFYENFLNTFENLIWMDGNEYSYSYTFNYVKDDVLSSNKESIPVNNFTITETHTVVTENNTRSDTVTVTEQNYKQISIPTIQTLGLHKVNWKVGGVKNTSDSSEINYFLYVKPKPKSVNWLLERLYGTPITTTGTSYRLSSHHLNLDPDKEGATLPPYKKNVEITGSAQNVNNFGTTISTIQTRTTRNTNVVFKPVSVGYTDSTTNFDTIISVSLRHSDLNSEDTPIFKINYNGGSSYIVRKNYIFNETNGICIPSDDITDTTKQHLIQFVRHAIWGSEACGQNQSKYIDLVYIDGVLDNANNDVFNGPMRVDSIELLPCDVDYNLIDIEYYKPLIIRDTTPIKVVDTYDEDTDELKTKTEDHTEDRDILEMFMYNYWLRFNSSYNGVEFNGTFDQTISNNDGVLSNIIFDGGRIKITNTETLNNIAQNTAIPTLLLSVDYATSTRGGNLMDRIQVEGSGNGSTAIEKFGTIPLDDVLWSAGNGESLNSQLITASSSDDWESPQFYFKLQGSSTVNNRAKNLTLGIANPQDTENNKYVLFSPNYDANDESTFLPEQKWTLKTDVADSAHANNTSIGKFVNAVTEKPVRGSGKDDIKHLKNCLEGIPVMVFLRVNNHKNNTDLVEIHYLGMFNFNLGRDSHYNLGYNTATNTTDMIDSIITPKIPGKKPFSYAFVKKMEFEDGLVVGEISGNSPRFDFSQWNVNILRDPDKNDGSAYMFGDIVNDTNIGVITDMVRQVSLSGRYIFRQLGRHFNEGWKDAPVEKEGYRTYDANKNTYVNGFGTQYYWNGQSWAEAEKDNNLGSFEDVYSLLTDRRKEPDDTDKEEDVINNYGGVTGPMLDFTSLSEYYTICVAFGMVDSVLKNLNIKSWNGRTCYCQFYDMDCANGENNNGQEVIDYNVAMDFWSCIEKNGYVDGIDIQFDYWPSSGERDSNGELIGGVGYDFPSHYLFAVAKYGRQIMESFKNNINGIKNTQKYPQQLWAIFRGIPDKNELAKPNQKRYGRAHGELRSAEYFVNKYFNSGLGSMSKLFVNLNYDYKYFYRDGIVDKSTFKDRQNIGKITSFHGTREYKVKEWLDKRFHFLDAMFQLDGVDLIAGKNTTNQYTTIEEYNKLVGGETPGWVYSNFNLKSYTSYLDDSIPSYMNRENSFFVNDDDITGNPDVYIQNSAFHNRGEDPRQIGQGQHIIAFRCKPNTLFTLINGEDTTRYMLTKPTSEIQRIKIDLGGAKVLKLFGSKEIVYLEDINTFLRTDTLINSDMLTQIIATEESPVSSFTINAPMCTTIKLNKSTYQGTLKFAETIYTTADGQEIITTALANMKLLQELDISNSGLCCVSDTTYFDGNNTCTLKTLKINGVQNKNGIIKVTDMPNLTSINMSGSSSTRPTILKTLDINCIRESVTLNNTQIQTIKLEVANDCRNKDYEFVLNNDPVVETLELVGFKKVTINTCQNLKNVIIRDNKDAEDRHKLSEININNVTSTATTTSSVLNIAEDASKSRGNVYDLTHLVNLQKINFNRCNNMVTLRLPNHVIDMSETGNFNYSEGLRYIEGVDGYGIFIDAVVSDGKAIKNNFNSFFYNAPVQMVESNGSNGSSTILSNIYLGEHITVANSTWGWNGYLSIAMYKYILDNMFKDRYVFHDFVYNSNGSIKTKPYVTKVSGDFRRNMTSLSSCFYHKGFGYTINQAETDYKTCNATASGDIKQPNTTYKKRNLTTFALETFTIGNTTDNAISDKSTTYSITGANLVRPYMEAYVNLSGDNIWPNYSDIMFPGRYEQLADIKANTIIYTKGLLSYGSNVSSVGGFVAYGNRNQTNNSVIINLMLDTFANVGSKMSSFYLNSETNFYPTMRFWRYDSITKQLILIPNTESITISTFFDIIPNITSLSNVNFNKDQNFDLSKAFDKLTKLNSVSNLCYYNDLSNIRNIDGLFKNCPIKTCEKIFTEDVTIDDENASPFGTSNGTNTGNKTHYGGSRINLATFFKYTTSGIKYLLNGDTNKTNEICMPIPKYVTYDDFLTIWNSLTTGSSSTLESVDNLFANTVILMPNGSCEFNTNSPYEVYCNKNFVLRLGTSTTLFTKLSSAKHLFDNFEMWYIKNYYTVNDASVALSGFNSNTTYTIGQSGNANLQSGASNLRCKVPIFLKTRTFTPVKNEENKVIARDEEDSFLHKLRYVKNYAYAFRNFYFYKMLPYDFFAKRQKYVDAKYINPLYYFYEVPDSYSKPLDGQQRSSDAIYYKLQNGNLSVITDDNYNGKRYQWGDATVLSYNYYGNPDGTTTQNRITSLYRCFERTKFYSSGELLDESELQRHPTSFTFVAGTDNEYSLFDNPNSPEFDSGTYTGDRVLTASDFRLTYDYGDGVTRTDTFTTPYTRAENSNPHRLYFNRGNYSNISDMSSMFNGYDATEGLRGPVDDKGNPTYDKLDSFYVKVGSTIPYVIEEKPSDVIGEVFKIKTDKKSYTIKTPVVSAASTMSSPYNVYSPNDVKQSRTYYYNPTSTAETLSGKFVEKSDSNLSSSFKTERNKIGIRYAMYDWTTARKLYDGISRDNATGNIVDGNTPINVGGTLHKFYSYPSISYNFVDVTNTQSDMWYVYDKGYVNVTNGYEQSGNSASGVQYNWNVNIGTNPQNYSGSVNIGDNFNQLMYNNNMIREEIPSAVKDAALADFNNGYASFIPGSSFDMSIETFNDYINRRVTTETSTSNHNDGRSNKHFYIDEIFSDIVSSSNIDSIYSGYMLSKYDYTSSGSYSPLQNRRRWALKLSNTPLSGYNSTELGTLIDNRYIVNVESAEAIRDYKFVNTNYSDNGQDDFVDIVLNNSNCKNDFRDYCINKFLQDNYGGNSNIFRGISYSGLYFSMPNIKIGKYYRNVRQTDAGYNLSNVTLTPSNGETYRLSDAIYDTVNGYIIFAKSPDDTLDVEREDGAQKYFRIVSDYLYASGGNRGVKLSDGRIITFTNATFNDKLKVTKLDNGVDAWNEDGSDILLGTVTFTNTQTNYEIYTWVGAKYSFVDSSDISIRCYGPKVNSSKDDFVFAENNTYTKTRVTKPDLFKKKVVNYTQTVSVGSDFLNSATDYNKLTTHSTEKVNIPVRYSMEPYYYCTYVYEKYTYTKVTNIVKDTSYMDNVKAHIQLFGSTTNNDDNVIFGVPTYKLKYPGYKEGDKLDAGDTKDTLMLDSKKLYKIVSHKIYNYPTYSINVDYLKNGVEETLTIQKEGGYYLCPPDLLRGCAQDGCDLRYLFSYSNAVGALHKDMLKNLRNTKISNWLRNVDVLPQYIGHNTHVKQYTFIPAGFNLSGDLSNAFNFRYRLPKSYNPSTDTGNQGEASAFNNNSEYFICLKDSFALSGNYINVSSLKYAFTGTIYDSGNIYASIDGGNQWGNSGSVTYDYQPLRYTYSEDDKSTIGYNCHFYLCGTKGSNCYVPKGIPITLIGTTVKLDNMITNIAPFFMGPLFDENVHGEDITNSCFDSNSGTCVIYSAGNLLHPSVTLPKYLINPAQTAGKDKNNFGRIVYMYGTADSNRSSFNNSYNYVSIGTLGGRTSAAAYHDCGMPGRASVTGDVRRVTYYTDRDQALKDGYRYNLKDVDNSTADDSGVTPDSFYKTCHS